LDVQEVGHFLEDLGYFGILHGSSGSSKGVLAMAFYPGSK
jgi:hypothetical protein